MVTTTWIAGSGDWNTASNWSNGVPTAADEAVIAGAAGQRNETITGAGAAASLSVEPGRTLYGLTLAGSHALGTFLDTSVYTTISPVTTLSFSSATLANGSQFTLQDGASLGTGTLTLDNGVLNGVVSTLANPILLPNFGIIELGGPGATAATLTGLISGPGTLRLDGDAVLANPANSFSGGLLAQGSRVELVAGQAGGTAPVVAGGTLVLDPGVVVAPITAYGVEIDATDQTTTVYNAGSGLLYENGAGHANIVGSIDANATMGPYGPPLFGSFTVQGGTGSVTVFGGNESGAFYGGTGGNNVIIAGLDVPGPRPIHSYTDPQGRSSVIAAQPPPVTIVGGGNGDILVANGTDNGTGSNLIIAGAGNETLTGSGSSASNVFFGGPGADVIAAGSGASTIVVGSGAATISGGSASTAIFTGTGSDIVLGGSGADYVQAGAGNATLFAGAGMDLIGVINGQAGGSLVVSGFRTATDHISAQGYAAAPVVASGGGNTVLTFSDHTQVTLLGVASLPGAAFS